MGGRGTFAAGRQVPFSYATIDTIEGVKVLAGLNGKHGLPEEAHSSSAYIKLKPDGTFHEMRLYDKDHFLTVEIAYHPEPRIGIKGKPVLHYHVYDRDFHRTTHKMPKAMRKHFAKFFRGVKL